MSNPIPPSLKPVAAFIVKGTQMEKADPVIAYYCYLWAVQQLLAKELHQKGSEEMAYAIQLMDKLEQRKAALASNEAVTDDAKGQKHVEQFAMKIFTNAENAQNAGKCTKQTAETFLAAATFIELLKIFGDIDKEMARKIVFAKYHANRILKAIVAGEDPNLPVELDEEEPAPEFEPVVSSPTHPPPPTVEEAVDEHSSLSARMAGTSFANESLHPSRRMTPDIPRPQSAEMDEPVSPPASQTHTETATSAYDSFPTPPPTELTSSYFPPPPPTVVETASLDLPSAPTDLDDYYSTTATTPPVSSLPTAPPIGARRAETPPTTRQYVVSPSPSTHSQFTPPSVHSYVTSHPPSAPTYSASPAAPGYGPPPSVQTHAPSAHTYAPPPSTHTHLPPPPIFEAPRNSAPPNSAPVRHRQLIDPDKDADLVTKAQKHARFAISALNFDDIATAVRELQDALHTLGA